MVANRYYEIYLIILCSLVGTNAFMHVKSHGKSSSLRKYAWYLQQPMQQPIGMRKTSILHQAFNDGGIEDSDDDDDDDDDDDYISDDELKSNPSKFEFTNTNPISFGPGKGRSAPTQRKAMGKSGSGDATVHVCTNCGAEYVNWMGKCSTCGQWNTIQEFKVGRERSTSAKKKPIFGSSGGSGGSVGGARGGRNISIEDGGDYRPSSWLTGIGTTYNEPVRITDVYKEMGYKDGEYDKEKDNNMGSFDKRLLIPDDEELNNVLGGGIMPGSLTLLGGDPGVGKSTLLLQMAGQVASLSTPPRGIGMGLDDRSIQQYGPVLYVSGEENSIQIASRAMRLGIDESELLLFCETDADFIAETVVAYSDKNRGIINNEFDDDFEDAVDDKYAKSKKASKALGRRRQPSLLIIDSIQTMICDSGGTSSAGGVTQVRECVGLFLRLAKATGVPVILVGHVTKSGGVAGPRTVEHMVDTVLYLEGGAPTGVGQNLRMLRASKNRFGSSDEVGVYEMNGSPELGGRLIPVSDPSSLFLADRFDSEDLEGCAISIILEGMRPISVEVQALVTPAVKSFSGRRTVDGLSPSRLLLILAVLQKRCGISCGRYDVYTNVVGGIRLTNSKQGCSGSDLAVAVSLASSLFSIPVRSDTAFIGEIGLLGELRQVSSIDKRINEARRMGFSRVIIPQRSNNKKSKKRKFGSPGYRSSGSVNLSGIEVLEAQNLLDAIQNGLVNQIPKRKSKKKGQKSNDIHSVEILKDDYIIDDDEEYDDFGFQ